MENPIHATNTGLCELLPYLFLNFPHVGAKFTPNPYTIKTIFMDIQTFQQKANTLISQLEALINTMPHKGDTAADSQKIALLNDLKQVQMSVTGTEQKDLVNVFTCQVADDPDPDAESEIIRIFDENDTVVFSKSLYYLPQIFDGGEIDIELLKTYLVFMEGLMEETDILEGI